jgi:hypothetical protein
MPKQYQVTIAAGADFTPIRATTPCHYVIIWLDGDRSLVALEYQLPDDDFATTYTTDEVAGDPIIRLGHGKSGLIGRPPGYNASGQPALGTNMVQIRAADGSEVVVNVIESENQL